MNMTGIYMIQSISKPERVYVGSAMNIHIRRLRHFNDLLIKKHHSCKLQRHFNKYGESDLFFSIVEQFDFISKEHLLSREQHYMAILNPYFNGSKIAGSVLGIKRSEETRKKLRAAWKTRLPASKETNRKISKSCKGLQNRLGGHPSEETLQKQKNTWAIKRLRPIEQKNYRLKGRSPYLGVYYTEGRIRVQICVGGAKKLHLGRFKTEEEAARAYDKKARELYGEFANLNFKDEYDTHI